MTRYYIYEEMGRPCRWNWRIQVANHDVELLIYGIKGNRKIRETLET
jgi:hypothetical protein